MQKKVRRFVNAKIGIRLLESLKPGLKPYEVWDTEIPGFLLRVRPTGSLTYFLSYRRPDRSRKTKALIGKPSSMTPAQARDRARVLLGQVTQGFDPNLEKKKQASSSLMQDFNIGNRMISLWRNR